MARTVPPKPTVPIVLQIGDAIADIGDVELPITVSPATRDATGRWQLTFEVDHAEFRRRIADLLRGVADEFERGADGD